MPKMYEELASWWSLLSSPSEYEEEAAFYGNALVDACERPPRTVLELGSGGGNNASHLKARFVFGRADWLRLLSEVGFRPHVVPLEHSELEPGSHEVFVANRPSG